jgi:integrase
VQAGSARRSYGTGSLFESRGAWYGKWRIGDRQVKRKLGPIRQPGSRDGLTRKQAEAELRRVIAETRVPASRERLNVVEVGEQYVAYLRDRGRKRSTLGDYESTIRVHFAPAFGDRSIDRLTVSQIESYVAAKVREGKAAKTIRNHLGLLHSLFTFAEKHGWSRGNPCKYVEAPAADDGDYDIRFLHEAELAALLRAVDELLARVRDPESGRTIRADALRRMYRLDRVLYLTGALTGLRQGELLGLRWRDIDWTAERIRVRRAWVRGEMGTPKSKRSSRSIPMARSLARELRTHHERSAYQTDDDLVFAHPDTGAPLDRSKLFKRFKTAARRAGLGNVRFHDLRHTFGTRMAAAGTPIRTLQEWMGHRDFKTTLIYADYAPSDQEADMIERAFGR